MKQDLGLSAVSLIIIQSLPEAVKVTRNTIHRDIHNDVTMEEQRKFCVTFQQYLCICVTCLVQFVILCLADALADCFVEQFFADLLTSSLTMHEQYALHK